MKQKISFPINKEGFTLIEVLVAVVLFTVGILAANAMQISSIKGNSKAQRITESANWASDRVEFLLGLDYTDGDLDDDDGDGDGGLDDIVSPDGTFTSPDGLYTVFWNVAEDYPMPNIKTVQIIVDRTDVVLQKKTEFLYYKIDTF